MPIQDYSYANLAESDFSGANFASANLKGANFGFADLTEGSPQDQIMSERAFLS